MTHYATRPRSSRGSTEEHAQEAKLVRLHAENAVLRAARETWLGG